MPDRRWSRRPVAALALTAGALTLAIASPAVSAQEAPPWDGSKFDAAVTETHKTSTFDISGVFVRSDGRTVADVAVSFDYATHPSADDPDCPIPPDPDVERVPSSTTTPPDTSTPSTTSTTTPPPPDSHGLLKPHPPTLTPPTAASRTATFSTASTLRRSKPLFRRDARCGSSWLLGVHRPAQQATVLVSLCSPACSEPILDGRRGESRGAQAT